ncbi:hypothetical protein N480_03650 [Pseudoalteromonas luteoviolacea S2607]|uniref:restriction endonuclease n=1 Tax=Pseudoalteromonas luteoviolacea TaxID=43657 RepID=UPI0007B0A859|nr:restriction endonuclease [Pseudoalteromonas luteoviolacea]KZN30050.1 hypothetical protein N480_03650 [Pseudoalteromonas luteoviolacea S2607]
MIYSCQSCSRTTFHTQCWHCIAANEDESPQELVPLNASFYSDFHYESKGFVKDLFAKKKEQAGLDDLLKRVLKKYNQLREPYFCNFAYLMLSENKLNNECEREQSSDKIYSQVELFQEVLVRKGFSELNTKPELLYKLLDTTLFHSRYLSFKKEIERHLKPDLTSTMYSWIEETGTDFRNNMCLFLYTLWESKVSYKELDFNDRAEKDRNQQLVEIDTFSKLIKKAENIFKDILVSRLDVKLSNFDSSSFVTVHSLDAMNGFEFEEFLAKLFIALGYDVTETKKTGDQGADLFVEKFGRKVVIQAKNYSGNVGNSAVQQALSAKTFYNCDDAMVVTNSYFTHSANELASASAIKLVDRSELMNYLDDYNQYLIEAL